jgi:hypothetical protein
MNCFYTTIPRAGLLFSLWKNKLHYAIISQDWIHALALQTSINVVTSTSIEVNGPLDAARTHPSLFLRRLKDLSYHLYHVLRFPSGNAPFETTFS